MFSLETRLPKRFARIWCARAECYVDEDYGRGDGIIFRRRKTEMKVEEAKWGTLSTARCNEMLD